MLQDRAEPNKLLRWLTLVVIALIVTFTVVDPLLGPVSISDADGLPVWGAAWSFDAADRRLTVEVPDTDGPVSVGLDAGWVEDWMPHLAVEDRAWRWRAWGPVRSYVVDLDATETPTTVVFEEFRPTDRWMYTQGHIERSIGVHFAPLFLRVEPVQPGIVHLGVEATEASFAKPAWLEDLREQAEIPDDRRLHVWMADAWLQELGFRRSPDYEADGGRVPAWGGTTNYTNFALEAATGNRVTVKMLDRGPLFRDVARLDRPVVVRATEPAETLRIRLVHDPDRLLCEDPDRWDLAANLLLWDRQGKVLDTVVHLGPDEAGRTVDVPLDGEAPFVLAGDLGECLSPNDSGLTNLAVGGVLWDDAVRRTVDDALTVTAAPGDLAVEQPWDPGPHVWEFDTAGVPDHEDGTLPSSNVSLVDAGGRVIVASDGTLAGSLGRCGDEGCLGGRVVRSPGPYTVALRFDAVATAGTTRTIEITYTAFGPAVCDVGVEWPDLCA